MVKKERQSNIELLRLVAMFLIVCTHANIFTLGRPKFPAFEAEPVWVGIRFGLQSFTYIGVNLFILISGYFSIKTKVRNVAAFLFQVWFYAIVVWFLVYAIGLCLGKPLTTWSDLGSVCCILTSYNWFIPAYLLLMLFAPMVNMWCDAASKRQLELFLLVFYAASIYLGWCTRYCKEFNDGYSFVCLLLLYVTGRYLRLHGSWLTRRSWKVDATHYMLYVLINTAIALYRIKTPYKMSQFALNNPLELYGNICFFLIFTKIHFQSKTINTLAKGTFGIFLLHMHPQVFDYFRDVIKYMNVHLTHGVFLLCLLVFILLVCLAGILFDKPRALLWIWISKKFEKLQVKM